MAEKTFNTTELASELSVVSGLSKLKSKELIFALGRIIRNKVVEGFSVQYYQFGRFKKVVKPERAGYNPKTETHVMLPERTVPKFVPSSYFKTVVSDSTIEEVEPFNVINRIEPKKSVYKELPYRKIPEIKAPVDYDNEESGILPNDLEFEL